MTKKDEIILDLISSKEEIKITEKETWESKVYKMVEVCENCWLPIEEDDEDDNDLIDAIKELKDLGFIWERIQKKIKEDHQLSILQYEREKLETELADIEEINKEIEEDHQLSKIQYEKDKLKRELKRLENFERDIINY